MKNWGAFSASKNWEKIEKAVKDTTGIILVYNGTIANPLFHSNSGGCTENSEDVWDGISVPYLRSVISKGDEFGSDYKTDFEISSSDLIKKMKAGYPDFKYSGKDIASAIQILEYTGGGRVKSVKVGNITMKGTDFRKLLNLKSANFIIQKGSKDEVKLTTYGNGHGVGLSQWGSNYMAKSGGSFDEILKYYYTGIKLSNTNMFK
jgi:stage II sporulation protein D